MESLRYREFRRVHVQGFIAGVSYRLDPRCLDMQSQGEAHHSDDSDSMCDVTEQDIQSIKNTGSKRKHQGQKTRAHAAKQRRKKTKAACVGWEENKTEKRVSIQHCEFHCSRRQYSKNSILRFYYWDTCNILATIL